MINTPDNKYKYFLHKESKFFNFEQNAEKFLFIEYHDQDVVYLNLIDAFRRKYTLDEIKANKIIMDNLFNDLINPVKEILVYFSRNKLTLDIPNEEISKCFISEVIENNCFTDNIVDFDSYCELLASELQLKFINHLTDTNNVSLSNVEVMLLRYFDESFNSISFDEGKVDVWMSLSLVYHSMHFFIGYLNRLLSFQRAINLFFSLLLSDNPDEQKTLFISKFIITYEYTLLFDIILHFKKNHSIRFMKEHGQDNYTNNFASACLNTSKDYILNLFKKTEGSLVKDLNIIFDCFLFKQLEGKFKETLVTGTYDFDDYLEQTYKNPVFTIYNPIEHRYEVLCHDAIEYIIDFKYVFYIISGLYYGSFMDQDFLDRSMKALINVE